MNSNAPRQNFLRILVRATARTECAPYQCCVRAGSPLPAVIRNQLRRFVKNNRGLVQFGLTLVIIGTLVTFASAQSAGKKPLVRGESIDDSPPAAPATNDPAPAAPLMAAYSQGYIVGPAKTTNAPATASVQDADAAKDGAQEVDFSELAGFDYNVPETPNTNKFAGGDPADKQIPEKVMALNHKKINIIGFMMPLKEEGGKATEFLVMRTQSSCCFGIPPTLNELITVKAVPGGVPTMMDDLVEFEGTLKIGTMREEGYIVGVYQMDDGKFVRQASR